MKQSPRRANIYSVTQQIPTILWNQKFYFLIHNSFSQIPILSQMSPVQTTPYFFKIYANIFLPLTSALSSGLFPSDFFTNLNMIKLTLNK
jgi:hypothetical protein